MIGEIEKFSCYEFEIFEHPDDDYPTDKYYTYKIYTEGWAPYDDGVIDSEDSFDSAQRARFAAIGHISLLEEGAQE